MIKYLKIVALIFVVSKLLAGESQNINWITNNSGSWFDSNNWVEARLPLDGDEVRFGVTDNDTSIDEVDVDNFSKSINLPSSLARFERKVIFSDGSALGDPQLADDGMVFNVMAINGAGGKAVTFNVPVTADTMTSNRHGGIFNREIAVNTILAESSHQDKWQINASATGPVIYLLIDENRGPDGGNTDGFFEINSDLQIGDLEQVWGSLIVGVDSLTIVNNYLYFDYTNQNEDNNINPITIDGILSVDIFTVYDTENDSYIIKDVGSYGSIDNQNADFQTDFITGEGLLIVNIGESIFTDGFEAATTAQN